MTQANPAKVRRCQNWTRSQGVKQLQHNLVVPPHICEALSHDGARTTRHALRKSCGGLLEHVEDVLYNGIGFALLDFGDPQALGVRHIRKMLARFAEVIGEPLLQRSDDRLLCDIVNKGLAVEHGARFSVTNSESSFHTDNSYGPVVPDVVGLYCVQPAEVGGLSQVASGYTVLSQLQSVAPQAYDTLRGRFCFDRRGEFKEGESPVSRYSVVHWERSELTLRYLKQYIVSGHRIARRPLTSMQAEAIELIDGIAREEDMHADVMLRPGVMLVTNNRWVLHNRTAFRDSCDPRMGRHLIRFWARRRG